MGDEYRIRRASKEGFVVYNTNAVIEAAFHELDDALNYIKQNIKRTD